MIWILKLLFIIIAGFLIVIFEVVVGPKASDDSPLYMFTLPAFVCIGVLPFFDLIEKKSMTVKDAIMSVLVTYIIFIAIWLVMVIIVNACNNGHTVWTNYRTFRETVIQDDAVFEYHCFPILIGKTGKRSICILNPLAWYDYLIGRFVERFKFDH